MTSAAEVHPGATVATSAACSGHDGHPGITRHQRGVVVIHAQAERCYHMVSDVTQMGRLSPECTGGRWIRGATDPAIGARFIGTNRRGWVRWFTFYRVVAADPGKEVAFETTENKIVWSYRFDGDATSTTVTESRSAVGDRPALARFLLDGEEREQEVREGMCSTLTHLKELAASDTETSPSRWWGSSITRSRPAPRPISSAERGAS